MLLSEIKGWSAKVKTTTVRTRKGVMTLPAKEMVSTLLKDNKGRANIGSIIKWIQFYMNRAGSKLKPADKENCEKAKHILQKMNQEKD